MHRSLFVAALAASLSIAPACASAGLPEPLGQARDHLARGNPRAAVTVLEEALTVAGSPSDRTALLDLLRQAYELAAQQAESAGQVYDAEMFRDNLAILNRSPSVSTHAGRAGDSSPPAQAAPPPGAAPQPLPPPTAEPSQSSTPFVSLPTASPAPIPTPIATPAPAPAPGATMAPQARAAPPVEVADADAAFAARRYSEAGRLYEALERERRLPRARREHWAYCRWVDVVRRINAGPRSPQEWAQIDDEIQKIRALCPQHWYGEYLRNLAAERAPKRRAGASRKVVVRGASPDEPRGAATEGPPLRVAPEAVQPTAGMPRPGPEPSPMPRPAEPEPIPAPAPAPEAAPDAPRAAPGWQVRETANFRILHVDPALAERVAQRAEQARDEQIRRWMGPEARGPWLPKCDLYLYPTAQVFHRMTGQPEESPGFSTMGLNAGRVIARRVNLRADHPNLVEAVLPHEITHVVLADLFPHQQVPRWADEGMAVLAEPPSEQAHRATDLDNPLTTGQLFKVEDLMVMDYPDGKYWGLYYAQSVSLTRFLVEQGTPAQFIEFVQGTQRNNHEAELRRIYQIDGFADLQRRWLAYAQAKASESAAVAVDSDARTNTARR